MENSQVNLSVRGPETEIRMEETKLGKVLNSQNKGSMSSLASSNKSHRRNRNLGLSVNKTGDDYTSKKVPATKFFSHTQSVSMPSSRAQSQQSKYRYSENRTS